MMLDSPACSRSTTDPVRKAWTEKEGTAMSSTKLWIRCLEGENSRHIEGMPFERVRGVPDLLACTLPDSIALTNPAHYLGFPICRVTVRDSSPANSNSPRGVFQLGTATAEVELGNVGFDGHYLSQDIEIVSGDIADARDLYLAIKTNQMDGVVVLHHYQHPTPPAPVPSEDKKS